MKIKQFFKKAAATVMAAVTVLSLLPTTAFAATGDVGTISFTRTYDSAGNAMYYNSSAVINGYTAGGTGKNKYRMYVDGSTAFCIQPGVPLKTGNQLTENSSETWNALSASQKKAVGLALLYGYQGNRDGLTGSDDEKWLATQTLVWEFVTGCRNSTGSFAQTDTTVYSLHFGSNYPNSGARAAYDQIVSMLTKHNTVPSFMNGSTRDLEYKDGQYVLTLTDTNGVLSEYSFSSSDRNVSVSKSGNTLTISSANAFSGSVRITATRNNIPVVSESAKLIAYGDPNLQDLVTGVENTDGVSAYLNVETPTGTIGLKKTSEDGKVEGITFTVEGNGIQQTVKTNAAGEILIDGLTPGVYTVTEQSYEKYEPQSVQRVTVIGGRTSTVTFNNVLKRGDLTVTKTSEDGLVEGMKFHLYGTSLSGIAVDEYAVTDSSGKAYFKDVLIGSGYVLEEVDTPIRYVVPESQTAAVEWNTVTEKSVSNVLKKWNATVTKSDRETGTAQGNAYLAGATYFCDSFGFKQVTFHPEKCGISERMNEQSTEIISVLLVEPGKYPRMIEIEDSLEAMQRVVGGDIEEFMPYEDDIAIICNEEGKMNGMSPNRAIYSEPEEVEMTYGELTGRFRQAEREGRHISGYIVFTQDSFTEAYSEEQRTYAVSSNNKAFIEGMGGYSIYASSLDGSDPCVRLEAYMADEHGGKDGWKIERCYMKDPESREMVDIIFGQFFVCYAPAESEKFLSLPKELAQKYEARFKFPERFFKQGNEIKAVPYKPKTRGQER